MIDEECKWYYEQIVDILEKEGLVDLVEKVEEQIHQGKVQIVNSVETFRVKKPGNHRNLWTDINEQQDDTQFERGRRGQFLSPSDYSVSEQLHLLIEAVRIRARDQINIEERTLHFLQERLNANTLVLYSEESNQDIATFRWDTIQARREHVKTLLEHLDVLNKEIGNGRS